MQTVGLAQAEIENRGIPTASITMLPDITRKIRPPRALTEVLLALMALLDRDDVPVLEEFGRT